MTNSRLFLVLAFMTIAVFHDTHNSVLAKECNQKDFVYGENEIVDQLLTCSLSNSFDLDLTPSGDHAKSTSKTLIDQGLSNRTSILHARLSGIWTAKRPSFIETGWRCDAGKMTSTAVIELSSLSLEVVEKVDAPMYRSQYKLAAHRPCKTFDLPVWMCRQTKPIYRTISTWVNRAYYNLTLTQNSDDEKATIARLSPMFTCPETFRQRITHSPSSTYLLTKHSHGVLSAPNYHNQPKRPVKREFKVKNLTLKNKQNVNEIPSFGHPNSFTSTQSSNMPASPLYHNSVKRITSEVTQVLRSAIGDCISSLEANLNLMNDYRSFKEQKYSLDVRPGDDDETFREDVHSGITNECSNKLWIKSRVELANQLNSLDDGPTDGPKGSPTKRNQIGLSQPDEPNELLNPYGFYHDTSADRMID